MLLLLLLLLAYDRGPSGSIEWRWANTTGTRSGTGQTTATGRFAARRKPTTVRTGMMMIVLLKASARSQ
uniref:Putative secreted protein n=1 Tax=Anopheles marajoara TaxID=58244 RepID=A0A2M4CEW8_9DIPT